MAHKHHHHDDDEVSAEQMEAVGAFPLPGVDLLLPFLLKAIKQYGLPLVAGKLAKAIFLQKVPDKAGAQAAADGSEIEVAKFHARGTNQRMVFIKEGNRPTP